MYAYTSKHTYCTRIRSCLTARLCTFIKQYATALSNMNVFVLFPYQHLHYIYIHVCAFLCQCQYYIYMRVCVFYISISVHRYGSKMDAHERILLHNQTWLYSCAIYIFFVYMRTCIYVYMYVYIYIYMYTNMCTYKHICIDINVYCCAVRHGYIRVNLRMSGYVV